MNASVVGLTRYLIDDSIVEDVISGNVVKTLIRNSVLTAVKDCNREDLITNRTLSSNIEDRHGQKKTMV